MGPLPQHSAMEMRRYMNRFLPLLPDLSVMSHVLRTRFDQYEAIRSAACDPRVTRTTSYGATATGLATPSRS